jgi:hypothetical protein
MEKFDINLHNAVLYQDGIIVTFESRHYLGNILFAALMLHGRQPDAFGADKSFNDITIPLIREAILGDRDDTLAFLHELIQALPGVCPKFRVKTDDTLSYKSQDEEYFITFHDRHYIGHVLANRAAKRGFDANTFVNAKGQPTPELIKFLKSSGTNHAHNIQQGSRESAKNKQNVIQRFPTTN